LRLLYLKEPKLLERDGDKYKSGEETVLTQNHKNADGISFELEKPSKVPEGEFVIIQTPRLDGKTNKPISPEVFDVTTLDHEG
jgi:hypothetical protein